MSLEQLIEEKNRLKEQDRVLKQAFNKQKEEAKLFFEKHLSEYIDGITVSLNGNSYNEAEYYPYHISRVTFEVNKKDDRKIKDFCHKLNQDWINLKYKKYDFVIHLDYQGDRIFFFFENDEREVYPEGTVEKNNIAFLTSVYEFLKEHNITIIRPDEKKFKTRLKEEVNKALKILGKEIKREEEIEKKRSKINELFNKCLFKNKE